LKLLEGVVTGEVVLDVHTTLCCMLLLTVGVNAMYFYTYTKVYSGKSRFIPKDDETDWFVNFSEDMGIFWGMCITLVGTILTFGALVYWGQKKYGNLSPELKMRIVISIDIVNNGWHIFLKDICTYATLSNAS